VRCYQISAVISSLSWRTPDQED